MTPTENALTTAQIEQKVKELGPWFHNLDIQGVRTAPNHFLGDYPNQKWKYFSHALPEDLSGKTVLDIGCNAGFYSMEMKRRGAKRVVGVDSDPHYLAQARFAAQASGYDIEFQQLSVYEVGQLGEKFDLVIFMGVFYHLRHPLLALDLIYENVASDWLLFQSMQRGSKKVEPLADDYDFFDTSLFESDAFPQMYFIEKRYSNDPTNWWIPNRAGSEAMLRSAGFDIVDHPEAEVYVCRRREMSGDSQGPHAVYPVKIAGESHA